MTFPKSTTHIFPTMQKAFEALDAALIKKERENKSIYYALSDSLDPVLRDQFQDMIQECHNEELPNDWRYSIVKRLSWTFAECLDNRFKGTDENERDFLLDESFLISDNCVDIANSDLFQWLADYTTRSEFNDDYYGQKIDLVSIARARQCEEIEFIAHTMINGIDQMSTCSFTP